MMKPAPTKIFFPNLDGLRFIAFFAVFFHHSLISNCFSKNPSSWLYQFVDNQKQNGALGVNLFFVLSGFLITYLLVNEKEKFKRINVKNFYIRRVLRIWPLYFFMVLAGFVLFPLIKKMLGDAPNEIHTPGFYFLFISNFQLIQKGFADSSILNVLWSVGVEEQFYILWPLLLAFTPKKYLIHLFSLLILITIAFRYFNVANARVLYYHTISVFSDMVIGGLAAYLTFYNRTFLNFVTTLPKKIIVLVYLSGFCIIIFNYKIFTVPGLVIVQRLVYSLFFAFIILEQNFADNSIFKMSKLRLLSKWGTYTYGLYCLHTIGLLSAHVLSEKILKLHNAWFIMTIDFTVGLGVSMIMAYLSYRFFELPFLKLKERFSYFVK